MSKKPLLSVKKTAAPPSAAPGNAEAESDNAGDNGNGGVGYGENDVDLDDDASRAGAKTAGARGAAADTEEMMSTSYLIGGDDLMRCGCFFFLW